MLEAVAVCRHPDGREHPAPLTADEFPTTCHQWRERGGRLRWIIRDLEDLEDPDR
jgi:hypothetical protein